MRCCPLRRARFGRRCRRRRSRLLARTSFEKTNPTWLAPCENSDRVSPCLFRRPAPVPMEETALSIRIDHPLTSRVAWVCITQAKHHALLALEPRTRSSFELNGLAECVSIIARRLKISLSRTALLLAHKLELLVDRALVLPRACAWFSRIHRTASARPEHSPVESGVVDPSALPLFTGLLSDL